MYEKRVIDKENSELLAREWMKRAVDHQAPLSYTNYATMILGDPKSTTSQITESIGLLQRASALGDSSANLILGRIHLNGVAGTLQPNPVEAFKHWYNAVLIAPELANNWPMHNYAVSECVYSIGNSYFLGLSIPSSFNDESGAVEIASVATTLLDRPNYNLAFEFWTLATSINPHHVKSLLQLGNLYYDGLLDKKPDFERALVFYEQALEIIEKEPDSGVTEELKSMLFGLHDNCLKKLKLSELTKKDEEPTGTEVQELLDSFQAARPQTIRLFTRQNKLQDNERQYINTAVQIDLSQKRQYDALANRWKFLEQMRESLSKALAVKPEDSKSAGGSCSIM